MQLVLLQGPQACTPLHPVHRPTCKPVRPTEPEAKCIQWQGVDEVHEQMDQALYSDHQEPELQHRWCPGPLSWDRGQSHTGMPIAEQPNGSWVTV